MWRRLTNWYREWDEEYLAVLAQPELAAQAPALLTDQKTRDTAQPGPQLRRFAQSRQFLPGGHEGLLGQVFALANITRGAISQRGNQGLIPFNNQAKSLPFPAQAFGHQRGIAEFRRTHRFACDHTTL